MTHPRPQPDYQALSPLGAAEVHLRFSGPFEGRPVLWDARFISRHHCGASHSYIDIGEDGPEGYRLTVVLDVHCFDAPTVHKAIIMVRQYKRLHRGRHEFGSEAK